MHPKFNGGARSIILLALAFGASACGSSRVGNLFASNEKDAGPDASVPEETSTSSETSTTSGDSTSEATTDESSTSPLPDGGLDLVPDGGTSTGTEDSTSSIAPNPSTASSETSAVTSEPTSVPPETGTTDTSGQWPGPDTLDAGADSGETNGSSETSEPDTDSSLPDGGGVGPVPTSCVITTPNKSVLNGLVHPDGDRVNAPNAPFKTEVVVTTNAPDGAQVVLSMGPGPSLLVLASGGTATFPAVELEPDGQYTLTATCHGLVPVQSEPVVVTVDTTGPQIGTGISPAAGQHYSPGDDEDPSTPEILDFSVCVPVASSDALGTTADNVCVWTGAAGPFCGRAVEDGVDSGVDGVCIPVTCPGSAPFNVDVRVTDEAGNFTTALVGGVTCASRTPTVELLSLVDNRGTPNDVGIRLLAANNTNPNSVLKDSDASEPGAQHAVIACTNAYLNSSAELFVGLEGQTLSTKTTATVVADINDECPSGLSGIVRFPVVTLDESQVEEGVLQEYTVVRVTVTEESTEMGTSPDVHVWVDSTLPDVTLESPLDLCDDIPFTTDDDELARTVALRSDSAYPIEAVLVRKSDDTVIHEHSFVDSSDSHTFVIPLGHYALRATAVETSGNVGQLPACDIQVADLPLVTWVNPLSTTEVLGGAGVVRANLIADGDSNTSGWQGTLRVSIAPPTMATLEGTEVQFQVGGADYGTAEELEDSSGEPVIVELPVSVDDGTEVKIGVIVTHPFGDVVSELTVVVDTTPPGAPSAVSATVSDRRETSMQVSWDAVEDAVGYEVVYLATGRQGAPAAIDDSSFDSLPVAAEGGVAGTSVTVRNLTIEQPYTFGVRPFDAGGNKGPITVSTPVTATFNKHLLLPPAGIAPGSQWGFTVDGSADLNGDGASDLVVGQKFGDRVYIYLGQAGGVFPSVPNVEIIGPPDSGFGTSVAVVGDVVGGVGEDIAIAAPYDGEVLGRVYLVAGGNWPQVGEPLQVIDLSDGTSNAEGSTIEFPSTTPLPMHVARLGDFDGDGAFDFAIHANGYGPTGPCDDLSGENCDGALIVIRGTLNPADFPATVTVPDDTERFLVSFPSPNLFYGYDWLLGITDLHGARSGVLAAEYQEGAQRLLAYDGDSSSIIVQGEFGYGPPAFDGNGDLTFDTEIGSYPAALVGSDLVAIQLTGARDGQRQTPGVVDLYRLNNGNPFDDPSNWVTSFRRGGDNNNFGQILVGNRFGGRPANYSKRFFGTEDGAPYLIMGGGRYQDALPKLFMLRGETLANAPAASIDGFEILGWADVELPLSSIPEAASHWPTPADWSGGLGFGVHDMNGDGYADVAISEWADDFLPLDYQGGIVVLY